MCESSLNQSIINNVKKEETLITLPDDVLQQICFYLRLTDIYRLNNICNYSLRKFIKECSFIRSWNNNYNTFSQWKLILDQKLKTCVDFNSNILKLEKKNFTSFPIEIEDLDNISELWLNSNFLIFLPCNIGNLKNLKELSLFDNQLISLPPEIGKLTNLSELWLNSNHLTSIPVEIGHMTNLTKLGLGESG